MRARFKAGVFVLCASFIALPASAGAAGGVLRPAARWHAREAPANPAPRAPQPSSFEVPILVPHPGELRRAKAAAARRLGASATSSPASQAAGPPRDFPTSGPFGPSPEAAVFNGLNQPGLGAGNGSPPDPTGAIGPDAYVEMVNSEVGMYDRTNLGLLTSATLDDFVGAPGDTVFDPQIQWDPVANRWLYAADDDPDPSTQGDNNLAFGWSKTANPSSLDSAGWCRYMIHTGAEFDDFPKLGHDDGHLMIGSNVFDDSPGGSGSFLTARIWRIDKPANGATTCPSSVPATSFGSAASPLKTADNALAFTPVPANTFDASTNGYVVAADFNNGSSASQIMVWHIDDPSAPASLTADGDVNVASYDVPPNVPQPLPSINTLDSSDTRLTQAVAQADPDAGGAEAVWTQHTVAGGGGSVVRWYELLPQSCALPTCPAAAKRQEGTVSNPSNFVFNGSISPSSSGNDAVIEYNLGGSSQLAQIRAQSRGSAAPPGQMGDEVLLGTSTAADQDFTCLPPNGPPCRWGDYSGASPDPANAGVVWGTNQLIGTPLPPPNQDAPHWTTRNFALTVGVPPDTTITAGPSGRTGNPNPSFSFTSSQAGSTFECRLDAQAFASCASPQSYSGLSDGNHSFEVRAVNGSGNPDPTPASRSFFVDTAPPRTRITSGPRGTTRARTAAFRFRANEPGSSFACKLGRGGFRPCRSPNRYRRLKPGRHVFKVKATDSVGNVDRTPAKRRWTITR